MGNALLDLLQGASNAAASNVSAPVDAIAWALRKLGVPVPQNALGSSQWMAEQGLTKQPQNKLAGMAGETLGLIAPIGAAAYAPQIAAGVLKGQQAAGDAAYGVGQKAADMAEGYMASNGLMPSATEKLAYGIEHRPMAIDGGAAPLHDLTQSFPADVYTNQALQLYGSGLPQERNVLRLMQSLRGKPDAAVTIYRGGPSSMTKINPGDWVALDKQSAMEYAQQAGDGGKLISMQVPASHVTSWPDSLLEFGYYPPAK